jgi:CBS domain-containing protein
MKKNETVAAIMTEEVMTVQVKDDLQTARNLMVKNKIRHVPVLQGKKLVGIISRTDIDRLSFSTLFTDEGEDEGDEAAVDMLTIAQVMTHKPRVVTRAATIREVAQILTQEEFHALPVVDEKDPGKLAGIVTTTDVIRHLLTQL